MAKLQDLPPELTVLVVEELGGGELRRDVRFLTLYRKWYEAAHAVFHSGIHLSNISIHGCNVNRLGDVASYSGERRLMHKNTRNIDISAFGHWHDKAEGDFGLFPMDDIGIMKSVRESEELANDPFVFGERPEKAALSEWQTRIFNPRLQELFGDLDRFTFLENLTFQAMQGTENNGTPIEKFVTAPTMCSLFDSLSISTGLKKLTLDICCEIDSNGDDFHMCERLSRVLPRVESVRLRLRSICPHIFRLENSLRANDVRLKTLIIKMHLPRYPKCSVPVAFRAETCAEDGEHSFWLRARHAEDMTRGAREFLDSLAQIRFATIPAHPSRPATSEAGSEKGAEGILDHGLKLCRISYADERGVVRVVDCLTMQDGWILSGWPQTEYMARQDYGNPCWFEGDESVLAIAGPLKFQLNGE